MEGDVRTLERRLHALKRHGANVLLVGASGVDEACSRLLGSDDADRRRLFVLGDGASATPEERGARAEYDPEHVGVVDVPFGGTRGAATDRTVGGGGPEGPDGPDGPDGPATPDGPDDPSGYEDHDGPGEPGADDRSEPVEPVGPAADPSGGPVPWARESDDPWYSRTAPSDLSAAARHAHVHLSRFETADPEPSEIRVCLDPLCGFAAGPERADLRRFLEVLTNRVRMARGMGHYHLSATADDDLREAIEPLFDATVETRVTDAGDVHQRWTLHADDVTTDWLPL
jgi:hypothetical protein